MQSTRRSRAHDEVRALSRATAAAPIREEHSTGRAIVGVAMVGPSTLTSLLGHTAANDMPPANADDRMFTIRAADEAGQRSSAGILIDRMYATRGYVTNGLPSVATPDRVTLTACEHEVVMGTITVGFDAPGGLFVDQLFRDEVDGLRQAGRKVCEFTKLAMDGMVRSRRVLASLFHVAYIYARRLNRYSDLLIEVNPRHVRYYERMLGFTVRSGERLNPRVNAPAVLLALDLSHAETQIAELGGSGDAAAEVKSLYPYFFSPAEEAGIVRRLQRG